MKLKTLQHLHSRSRPRRNRATLSVIAACVILSSCASLNKLNLGTVYMNQGMHDKAVRTLTEYIESEGFFVAIAYNNRGLAKFNRAKQHRKLSAVRDAIRDFDMAIAIRKDLAVPYANRGLANIVLGNNKAAIVNFDRAIKHYRGTVSLESYNKIYISLMPNLALPYGARGLAKARENDKQGSLNDIERAIAIQESEGLKWRAFVLKESNDIRGACRAIQRSCALEDEEGCEIRRILNCSP